MPTKRLFFFHLATFFSFFSSFTLCTLLFAFSFYLLLSSPCLQVKAAALEEHTTEPKRIRRGRRRRRKRRKRRKRKREREKQAPSHRSQSTRLSTAQHGRPSNSPYFAIRYTTRLSQRDFQQRRANITSDGALN